MKNRCNSLKRGQQAIEQNRARLFSGKLSVVSRDNNLYVVGDISRKCLDTTETNNYQVDLTISMYKDEVGHKSVSW